MRRRNCNFLSPPTKIIEYMNMHSIFVKGVYYARPESVLAALDWLENHPTKTHTVTYCRSQ